MIFNTDCTNFNPLQYAEKVCIVTDPPFNIGYKYNNYNDNKDEQEYFEWLAQIFTRYPIPFIVIHYPEALHKLTTQVECFPERVVSWVYNSNTPRQHRDIAFYGIKPDFKKVIQPYKNPNDKRIKARIERGILGGKLYDWWNINQVKNVNTEKTDHPCQMPLEVMTNIIGIIPDDYTIYYPFMGSGTTGVACVKTDRRFIGVELDETYYEIAKQRITDAKAQ